MVGQGVTCAAWHPPGARFAEPLPRLPLKLLIPKNEFCARRSVSGQIWGLWKSLNPGTENKNAGQNLSGV